jgi:hypothetical protein
MFINAVHFEGWPTKMDEFMVISNDHPDTKRIRVLSHEDLGTCGEFVQKQLSQWDISSTKLYGLTVAQCIQVKSGEWPIASKSRS